jgi:hypothetical protein
MKEKFLRKISLRRMVTIDDIAAMALFCVRQPATTTSVKASASMAASSVSGDV